MKFNNEHEKIYIARKSRGERKNTYKNDKIRMYEKLCE